MDDISTFNKMNSLNEQLVRKIQEDRNVVNKVTLENMTIKSSKNDDVHSNTLNNLTLNLDEKTVNKSVQKAKVINYDYNLEESQIAVICKEKLICSFTREGEFITASIQGDC